MSSELAQFAISAAAIAAVVALTWFLGFREEAVLSGESEAKGLMRLVPGGFEPVQIALDARGAGAIGRGENGEFVILVPHGLQFIAYRLDQTAKIAARGDLLEVSCPAIKGGPVALQLGESAPHWTAADIAVN